MRKAFALAIVLLPFIAHAQNDTLYFHSGKKLSCEVTEVSEKEARYKYEGETLVNVVALDKLDSIRLSSGRVIPGIPRVSVSGEFGWRNVIVTEGGYQADGLVSKGEVTAYGEQAATGPFSKYADNRRQAVSYATENIMKEAAYRGCHLAVIRRVDDVQFNQFERKWKGKDGAAVNVTATLYAYPDE